MNENVPTVSTAGVVGTGSDPVHWKDKKKLREIVPMMKREKPTKENKK
jgi:hypothetical protein